MEGLFRLRPLGANTVEGSGHSNHLVDGERGKMSGAASLEEASITRIHFPYPHNRTASGFAGVDRPPE